MPVAKGRQKPNPIIGFVGRLLAQPSVNARGDLRAWFGWLPYAVRLAVIRHMWLLGMFTGEVEPVGLACGPDDEVTVIRVDGTWAAYRRNALPGRDLRQQRMTGVSGHSGVRVQARARETRPRPSRARAGSRASRAGPSDDPGDPSSTGSVGRAARGRLGVREEGSRP